MEYYKIKINGNLIAEKATFAKTDFIIKTYILQNYSSFDLNEYELCKRGLIALKPFLDSRGIDIQEV